eukprot:7658959-Alexandrium_andersonii.AAC.1
MSASLVGSEMCIRDRCGHGPGGHQGPRAGRNDRQIRPRPARERRGNEAVSYTHLTLPTICSV